eukprot:TRINITY_DN1220_c0_g2_i1.p1 TRINITY_DN1220_c0_g2~~TRINITY_DN1220_c0_g2_i1.p1  ORF type:complete len:152 (+),score=60.63 TRINITY_DN1220_c0_g2_i1:122-577(+)
MLGVLSKAFLRVTPKFFVPSAAFAIKYTKSHEWIDFDAGSKVAKIGITNFAQEHLGDIVHIELPKVNSTPIQGKVIGGLESVKAVSDIMCPAAGKILEVNKALDNEPGIINSSAEKEGWVAKMSLSNPQEVDSLMDESTYKTYCEEHKDDH